MLGDEVARARGGSSTTTRATDAAWSTSGHGRRRAGLPQPRVGRRRRAHHDRLRRAALLRRASAADRRWSRPGSPGWRRCSRCTTRARIGDPRATWGVIEGNPVHDDVRAIATATGVDFALDVVLDGEQRIVAGVRRRAARDARGGLRRARATRRCSRSPAPFDVVVTTNSGYPLDQNLYQAVKGMSAAAEVVTPGGTIVCAAECRDGFPDHGSYRELLAAGAVARQRCSRRIAASPATVPDQWQVQVQARVQTKAEVVMPLRRSTDDEVRAAHLEPIRDIDGAVADPAACSPPPGSACCRRALRRSPTWRDRRGCRRHQRPGAAPRPACGTKIGASAAAWLRDHLTE